MRACGFLLLLVALLVSCRTRPPNTSVSPATNPVVTASVPIPEDRSRTLSPTPTSSTGTTLTGSGGQSLQTTLATTLKLPRIPPSPFKPWVWGNTILYDLTSNTERDLGPGGSASFSPDSAHLVWLERGTGSDDQPQPIWVLDLATGAMHRLGAGVYFVAWLDNSRVFTAAAIGSGYPSEVIDVATGNRSFVCSPGAGRRTRNCPAASSGGHHVQEERGRSRLLASDTGQGDYVLEDLSGTHAPIKFNAITARIAQNGHVLALSELLPVVCGRQRYSKSI